MARPTNTGGLAGKIQGLREAKAAFQAMPDIVRTRMLEATETTVREIARGAQARLLTNPSVQTRNLYNHIAWKVTKTNGRGKVGVTTGQTVLSLISTRKKIKIKGIVIAGKGGGASGRVDTPSRRAHFVEFGTRKMKAEPFMIPSAEAEKQPYLDRCMRAGKAVETDTAKIGMRNA